VIEEKVQDGIKDSIMTSNLNPLKLMILMLDILIKISSSFKITVFRCMKIQEPLEERAKSIVNSFSRPEELKLILKETDLFGKDLLWYISEHNIYSILDTKLMDRILQDFWNSNIDVTGTFLEASSSFKILSLSSFSYSKDQEKLRRFHVKKEVNSMHSHFLQFDVWKKSMFVRYFLEAVFFLIMALFFQYFIAEFNRDLHILSEDLEQEEMI
jgi:hypothetical protein